MQRGTSPLDVIGLRFDIEDALRVKVDITTSKGLPDYRREEVEEMVDSV